MVSGGVSNAACFSKEMCSNLHVFEQHVFEQCDAVGLLSDPPLLLLEVCSRCEHISFHQPTRTPPQVVKFPTRHHLAAAAASSSAYIFSSLAAKASESGNRACCRFMWYALPAR